MNIYRTLFILSLCLTLFGVNGQPGRDSDNLKSRIEAYRAQFLTEELDLSPEEAQQFWPVYNQYRQELGKIQGKRMDDLMPLKGDDQNLANMSEAEIREMIEEEMNRQQKLLDLRKEYYEKFSEVLPVRKVAKFYRAEVEFQRKLIRRLADRKRSGK